MPQRKHTHHKRATGRAQLEKKLRAAEAEIKRLREKTKQCTCGPICPEERARTIRELCEMIDALPPESYDKRACLLAGVPYPPPAIIK